LLFLRATHAWLDLIQGREHQTNFQDSRPRCPAKAAKRRFPVALRQNCCAARAAKAPAPVLPPADARAPIPPRAPGFRFRSARPRGRLCSCADWLARSSEPIRRIQARPSNRMRGIRASAWRFSFGLSPTVPNEAPRCGLGNQPISSDTYTVNTGVSIACYYKQWGRTAALLRSGKPGQRPFFAEGSGYRLEVDANADSHHRSTTDCRGEGARGAVPGSPGIRREGFSRG
jgi:hypothetical protein